MDVGAAGDQEVDGVDLCGGEVMRNGCVEQGDVVQNAGFGGTCEVGVDQVVCELERDAVVEVC